MTQETSNKLSRREREIMDIIYRRGQATAADVYEDLGHNPTYSAVRSFLRILEEKGHLLHKKQCRQYLYYPSVPRENAVKSAIQDLLGTFFNNSTEQAVAALLDIDRTRLTDADLDRMAALIEKARKEGH
jgi:BlaI family transcriptional regulator, penicillinase repressor